jgi:HlyD family secretion protein
MIMKKRIFFLGPLVIAAAIGGMLYFRHQGAVPSAGIKVSGNIEITDVAVSFKIPGKVVERLVSEGDPVKTGQMVARLDDKDLNEEIAQRQAQVAQAQSVLAELRRGSRPEEIAQAEAVLERVQADGDRAKTEWERQKKLYEREVISTREYEAAKTTFDGTLARIREAREALTLSRKGPRQEKIDQAGAALEQSRQALALANTRKSYAVLFAPLSGTVLSDNIEPGEYVSPGTPVLTMGDLTHLYLRAYINETDLGRVKLGQKVRISTDTFPDRAYEGKITFIAAQAEFTPKNVQTQKERVKLVYRIKVDIPNPRMELKPGMPADGEIFIN